MIALKMLNRVTAGVALAGLIIGEKRNFAFGSVAEKVIKNSVRCLAISSHFQ